MPLLEVRDATLAYDGVPALHNVSLALEEGEIVAVIGPSGCGKTSLLRVIAGLEQAQSGEVWLDGARLDGTPTHRRGVGLMFQELALFPHLDVDANVAFGLRVQGLDGPRRRARVNEMLTLVGLAGYGRRKVHELSGGERQRVALARALAPRPRLLMLDEPVGALDRALREELLAELRAILRSQGLTALYVTHDQQEAFALAGRIVVMNDGRVRQAGPPEQIYRAPADVWVARFLGRTNLIPARVPPPRSPGAESTDTNAAPAPSQTLVTTPIGDFLLPRPASPGPATLLLGDERARVAPATDAPPGPNIVRGGVTGDSFHGRLRQLHLRAGAHLLSFAVDPPAPGEAWRVGDAVDVTLDPDAISLLPPDA